mmetsp:Transcript_18841/g.31424  ORF Transcript_18841/g.31424 Transcript_18841/m.31424 type:complete len:80 (+) Transcript_18841:287-526(+)
MSVLEYEPENKLIKEYRTTLRDFIEHEMYESKVNDLSDEDSEDSKEEDDDDSNDDEADSDDGDGRSGGYSSSLKVNLRK